MKKALLNTGCELGLELVTAICSFILPRLILSHFGSTYNGITSSITQFISCIALLKSGIGSVTRAALYKPLAEKNYYQISEIVRATESFMRKIAVIFVVSIVIFATFYPILVSDDFDWFFTFSLILILSISTFAQYFFGLTYQMLIQADQSNYIISLVQIFITILNTLVSSILILSGCTIHIVKLVSALVFLFPPLFYLIYSRKYYRIDRNIKPNLDLISQRWNAFGHQVANFINLNTDIMIITIFIGIKEVSIYTIYYMVANAVKKVIGAISSGITAAFGNMIAKGEESLLRIRFLQYELVIYIMSTILLTTTAILITPFISIYTKGVNDINYTRPLFGILICIAQYLACIKLPYEIMVFASSKFKETSNSAYIEAGLNIVISIIAVKIVGLNGVVIGTIVAGIYRTFRYNYFVSNNIIKRSHFVILKNISFTVISVVFCIWLSSILQLNNISGYIQWSVIACITLLLVSLVVTIFSFIFFTKDFISLIITLLGILKKGRKKNAENIYDTKLV